MINNARKNEREGCHDRLIPSCPLEAERIPVRIAELYLLHTVVSHDGSLHFDSSATKLKMSGIDIWTAEV